MVDTDQLGSANPEGSIEQLNERKERGAGFGLYLRSFGAEYFRFVEEWPDLEGHPEISPASRDLDSRLVEAVTAQLPTFALANVDDATPPEGLIQLFAPNDEWTRVADELIRIADLVVVYLGDASSGLLRELLVLDAVKAHDRTLIVLGGTMESRRLSEDLRELLARFTFRVRESAADVGAAMAPLISRLRSG